jgi:hypothetical protein
MAMARGRTGAPDAAEARHGGGDGDGVLPPRLALAEDEAEDWLPRLN